MKLLTKYNFNYYMQREKYVLFLFLGWKIKTGSVIIKNSKARKDLASYFLCIARKRPKYSR